MNRRHFGILGAATALTLALAACAPAASNTGGDTSLSDVKSKGEIVFGTEGTYNPFSYHDGGSGPLTGYDVEVAQAVAGKLGVKASFQETQFDGIFAGLDAKRFDVIANQISINPTRSAKYSMSTAYTVSPGVVVTKESDNSIHSMTDLKGKTTAQSLTSNWYKVAQDDGATVQSVEGWAQAVSLLKDGRVDATVNDKLTFLDYTKTNTNSGLKIAATTPDADHNAFALRKGATALTDAVNKALSDLATDGTLAKISTKYFGADVSK